jgi:hypothetical protein
MSAGAISQSSSLNTGSLSNEQVQPAPFNKQILVGPKAFYASADYLSVTAKELSQEDFLPVSYAWNTEDKIDTFVKKIWYVLSLPCRWIHSLVGRLGVLPASASERAVEAHTIRKDGMTLESIWKYKRLTVEVDGYKIDAVIAGRESTFGNGRWVLASHGNDELYEEKLCGVPSKNAFHKMLGALDSNAVVFNYPGVGSSTGMPNRQAMVKAYQAMLNFLEDQDHGIGAKQIIGYGHSIGGGVQGDALNTHDLKPDIKYVFVKSRTFSDLSTLVSDLTVRIVGFLVRLLGWDFSSLESSKKLSAHEIIIQTAAVDQPELLQDSSKLQDDGVITVNGSLAKALLEDAQCPRHNKTFIGIRESHNDDFSNQSIEFIRDRIKGALAT